MQHLDPAGGAPMVARRVLGCSLLLLLAATAAALLIVGNDASTGAHVATAVGRAADLPAMLAPSGDAASSPLDATIRREVITNGDAPPRTFAQFVDALVDLGLETARLADAGQQDDAIASDHEARELFRAMLAAVADADAMALAAMADLPFDDRPLATAMLRSGADASATTAAPIVAPMQSRLLRENVLMLTLSCGLSRRHEHIVDGRPDSAALTAGALATLQALPHLAERLGDELLVDQPYLGESHEPQVLDIVARSSDGTFPAATSTALLSTLWTNLQHSGARSSEHLAGLALLLLDDGNASERMAAARLLILDERYREVVLDHVRRTKHEGLARTLAIAAAQELPPTEAFAVLTTTAEITGADTGSFLTLAVRAPGLLQQEYEQRLGSDVSPMLRAALVTGAGFTRSPEGIEVAKLAFASDPDPEVRMRALFVLTGTAAEALGETAIGQALDDPAIGGDPERLGAVVLALENLARAGLVNAVHRLGARLRATPGLAESTREVLERLLAQTLPGGAAPVPTGH